MSSAKTQLFIPDKIKVGYQTRGDTYTGKLAYVIYFDKQGVLRKETSWNSWCDKKLKSNEYENKPLEGFVLNRHGGGHGGGWHSRSAFIRIWDPRDFEFEISPENLLFILREGGCSPGKGLEGKFVYSWQKDKLVLLPASSEDYRASTAFTQLQGQTVKAKDLEEGAVYATKLNEHLTYIGKMDYYFILPGAAVGNPIKPTTGVEKRFVFWGGDKYHALKDIKKIAAKTAPPVGDYAKLLDGYNKGPHGSRPVRLFLQERKLEKEEGYYKEGYWYEQTGHGVEPGRFVNCQIQRDYCTKEINYVQHQHRFFIKDGILYDGGMNGMSNPPTPGGHRYNNYYGSQNIPWSEPTNMRLFAEMASGSEVRVLPKTFNRE